MMKKIHEELSEDCWELILDRLANSGGADDDSDYKDLQSPSLVCKLFLSITDRIRRKLVTRNRVFYDHNCQVLVRALQRFPNLKEIELHDPVYGQNDDVNYPIRRIASSRLDLKALSLHYLPKFPFAKTFKILGSTMKNLTILKCCFINSSRNHDLVAIADGLPWLEELYIQFCRKHFDDGSISKSAKYVVTDAGIEAMSRKLPGLRKIDISGQIGCTDRSLIALSLNCLLLNEISCYFCNITENGICFLLRHSRNLVSLVASCHWSPDQDDDDDDSFNFENSMSYATSLRVLVLDKYEAKDILLGSIAKAGIPLEEILFFDDSGMSLNGFSTFIHACPSLKHLKLYEISILDDNSMRGLCRYLPNLVSIKLASCSNLSIATFFILAKECPVLSEIELTDVELQGLDDFDMDLEMNFQIKSLDLRRNRNLDDELLRKICRICPNLQTLKVWGPNRLTREGVAEILKSCSQIKNFKTELKYIYPDIFEIIQKMQS